MYTVVAQRELPPPPLELWEWLSRPELLARWFADRTPSDPAQGVRFDFGDGDFLAGRASEWDPGIALEWRWKFCGLGPEYEVRFSLLRRKAGTELSIQDRGALTTEEAECLRVGWSEYLLRLEKAITRKCSTRFSWRKALSLTVCLNPGQRARDRLLTDPGWLLKALDGLDTEVLACEEQIVTARVSAPDDRWQGAVTDLAIRIREIRGREYLYLSHEGWPRLPGPLGPAERCRFVSLWMEALGTLGVQ